MGGTSDARRSSWTSVSAASYVPVFRRDRNTLDTRFFPMAATHCQVAAQRTRAAMNKDEKHSSLRGVRAIVKQQLKMKVHRNMLPTTELKYRYPWYQKHSFCWFYQRCSTRRPPTHLNKHDKSQKGVVEFHRQTAVRL